MPGRRSNSPLSRAVGVAVAALAVIFLALDRWTGLNVPYGYDSGSSILFLIGVAVAVIVVALSGYRYFSGG